MKQRIDRAQLYAGLVILAILLGWQFILGAACVALLKDSLILGGIFTLVIGVCCALILWPITFKCLRAVFDIARGANGLRQGIPEQLRLRRTGLQPGREGGWSGGAGAGDCCVCGGAGGWVSVLLVVGVMNELALFEEVDG